MSELAAILAASAAFLLVVGPRPATLLERVGSYLRLAPERPSPDPGLPPNRLGQAGLSWTATEARARAVAAGAAGAFVGILAAQGDLFLTGPNRSTPALVVAGAAAGALGFRMWITSRRERRAAVLRQELPGVADTLALLVLAGESVASALERLSANMEGIAAAELGDALDGYRSGDTLPEALARAARQSAHLEAGRLYHLLANAHQTGGRLSQALGELAVDYRASLARDLTAEGGRRALAVYGPILGLMIPTTILFLMYPTLVGLRRLAGGP